MRALHAYKSSVRAVEPVIRLLKMNIHVLSVAPAVIWVDQDPYIQIVMDINGTGTNKTEKNIGGLMAARAGPCHIATCVRHTTR